MDRANFNSWKAKYLPIKKLLMTEVEMTDELFWIAKVKAAMYIWLSWVGNFLKADEGSTMRTETSSTGGPFFLTGSTCKAQVWHNDLQYWPGKSRVYFKIVNRAGKGKIKVCPGSHNYISNDESRKIIPGENFTDCDFLFVTFLSVC